MKGLKYLTVLLLYLIIPCHCTSVEISDIINSPIRVGDIEVDQYEVGIGEFGTFVEATAYITTADSLGWSGFFNPKSRSWEVAKNANWMSHNGKERLGGRYPVTHLSYYDVCAYCAWKNGRLPTALEWDMIAGDSVIVGNTWQGIFPYEDEGKDGYTIEVAPRGLFSPNKYDLFDLFGNVWEWTSSIDSIKNERIIKGGSFLCDYNVCAGYIPSRYQTTPDDSGLNHLGFRCVYDSKGQ